MKTSLLKLKNINIIIFIIIYELIFLFILYKVFQVPITHDETSTTAHYSNFNVWQIMMYPDNWPNNHVLNTLITKGFLGLFGKEQWVVRLPNLLSFLVYAFAVYRIIVSILKKDSVYFIPAAILFIANPYFLDFFGLCRGYGMSCSLCTLSVSYLISGYKYLKNKDIWLAFSLSILASYANFTLLVFWAAVTILTWLYFLLLRKGGIRLVIKPTLIILISCILYAALIAVPIYKMQSTNQFQYWYSLGFLKGTIFSIVQQALYGSTSIIPNLEFIIVAFGIIVVIFNIIYIVIQFRNVKLKIINNPVFITTTVLIFTSVISILQCKILHTPDLSGRTALFFYPLFIIVFITTIFVFSDIISMVTSKIISIFITLLCLYHLANTFSFKSVREWWFDANTYEVINYLKYTNGNQPVSLKTNWLYFPSFYFYKYTGKLPLMDLKDYDKSIDINTNADYYYILAEDYKTLEPKFEIVYKFTDNSWLLKKKTILKENKE